MSLTSTVNRNNYVGTSLLNIYAYTFKILDDDHMRVIVRDLSGVETVLTKTTHYTVSGVGAVGGGNVTLVNGAFAWLTGGFLTTGFALTLRRVVDLEQNTDIRNQGEYFPELHEDSFDKAMMIAQQQDDELDRSIKASETETVALDALPDAATRASQFLGFDASGQVIVGQPAGVPATPFAQTLLDDPDAATARTTLGFGAGGAFIVQGDLAAALVAKLTPSGVVSDYAGSVAPTGYVLCDGAAYDSTNAAYSALFAAIGNTWDAFNGQVAPGGVLFRVPKLGGMTTIGAGAAQVGTVATSLRALAEVLGAESVALIEANLPPHAHAAGTLAAVSNTTGISIPSSGSHSHESVTALDDTGGGGVTGFDINNTGDNSGFDAAPMLFISGGAHTHTVTDGGHPHTISGSTGSGAGASTAVANMQPSAAMNKIIKL